MTNSPPKRLQSQTERDIAGMAARRERHRSSPLGVPEFHSEDVTGQYEGEDLAQARARRPTPERLERLEKGRDADRADHKELVKKVDAIHGDVAEIRGEMKHIPRMLELLEGKEQTKRLGMANRTKIILGVLSLLGSGGIGAIIAALSGCAS